MTGGRALLLIQSAGCMHGKSTVLSLFLLALVHTTSLLGTFGFYMSMCCRMTPGTPRLQWGDAQVRSPSCPLHYTLGEERPKGGSGWGSSSTRLIQKASIKIHQRFWVQAERSRNLGPFSKPNPHIHEQFATQYTEAKATNFVVESWITTVSLSFHLTPSPFQHNIISLQSIHKLKYSKVIFAKCIFHSAYIHMLADCIWIMHYNRGTLSLTLYNALEYCCNAKC